MGCTTCVWEVTLTSSTLIGRILLPEHCAPHQSNLCVFKRFHDGPHHLLCGLKEFTGRAATRVGYDDKGTGAKISSLKDEQGSDVFVPISVDRKAANTYSGGCTDLCYPRTMTLTISYYQLDTNTKRIIDAKLKYDDFDKDPSISDYTLNFVYYPLDYWDLIIKFAFERTVFIALFIVIGCTSVLVAALYWVNVRLTTQVCKQKG